MLQPIRLLALLCACAVAAAPEAPAATKSAKMAVIPKWARFEQAFHSSGSYTNPLQQATLSVLFTSPLGETNWVFGFWDGGDIWRVRFSPDQPGRWTYTTLCSNPADRGLNAKTGQFLCTAELGTNRFHQHGPVRLASDRRHFEHADGTPFFWLADNARDGATQSELKDWRLYAAVRASQNFTVVQWTPAGGVGFAAGSALTGFPERIGVNPDFFRRLDAKLQALSGEGLLSAVCPLSAMSSDSPGATLPDEQALLVARYVVARWGADAVAWVLSASGPDEAKAVARCRRAGREVYAATRGRPVIVNCGSKSALLGQFRTEDWADALAFEPVKDNTPEALKSAFGGSLGEEWKQSPPRALITILPPENAIAPSHRRFGSQEVREVACASLLSTIPCGLIYSGQGVATWDMTAGGKQEQAPGAQLPLWHRAMFMPAAKQAGYLAGLLETIPFWQLQPNLSAVASPGADAEQEIAAAGTESKNVTLLYLARARTVEVYLDAMPRSPAVTWLNPRTGRNTPAVAVVVSRTCQFPTPEPGDWLLVMKSK